MEHGIVRSGSADIYYELHGDKGEYLVVLHGNGESMKRMQHQIEYFSKEYRVLAIDSRGHGESGFGQGSLNLATMALDVENVITELNIDRVNVLGFSDGANIAMLLAIKRPELVSRLILVGGNLKPEGFEIGTYLAVKVAYYLTKVAGYFDSKLRLEHEYYFLMAKEPNITDSMLKRITAKTLVIAGDKDMIKPAHTKKIADGIPNARLLMLEGDHFIIYRTPQVINEKADEFLKEVSEN
jgi:pimeloyl-ACP methyl ester carboxylesterase